MINLMYVEKIVGVERRFSLAGFSKAKHNKFRKTGLEDAFYFADGKTTLVHAIARHASGRRANIQLLLNAFDETGKRVNDFDTRLVLPRTLLPYAAQYDD